ncbi:uncharacterized protein LOC129711063 isoform X2 [Leucoraja erinacea]|uniref:uncharacterized protein LOC129711063 isoform X2 n=1 Tax=Leucoraja erinaceus TaxID=7782 RepID=UPI00245418AB|nr:uncharacterized protein LOC129711063 isoform X2 [Leucoraja erinacea]
MFNMLKIQRRPEKGATTLGDNSRPYRRHPAPCCVCDGWPRVAEKESHVSPLCVEQPLRFETGLEIGIIPSSIPALVGMRRAGLYHRRGKVEPIPSPQRQDISLLVSRCLSIGSGSEPRRPVATLAPSRVNWRASMPPSTLPTIVRSLPNPKATQVSGAGERGNSETPPIPPQHLPAREVRRITVDLRPVLARVNEPCEPTEEVMPEEVGAGSPLYLGDISTMSRHPANAGISKANPRPLARSPRKNGPFELLKVHVPLPPIVHPDRERGHGLDGTVTAADPSPKLRLLQVTEDGILANPDLVLHPVRCRRNQLVPFPKILLTTHVDKASADDQSTLRQESDLTDLHLKEIKQSFERSVEDPTIPFHQLMHQMRKRTSSANHVLIAEVLKSLREELWSTSQPSQLIGQNEDTMGWVRDRRSISLYRRPENRMDGQTGYMCPPANLPGDKLPIRLNLSKNR